MAMVLTPLTSHLFVRGRVYLKAVSTQPERYSVALPCVSQEAANYGHSARNRTPLRPKHRENRTHLHDGVLEGAGCLPCRRIPHVDQEHEPGGDRHGGHAASTSTSAAAAVITVAVLLAICKAVSPFLAPITLTAAAAAAAALLVVHGAAAAAAAITIAAAVTSAASVAAAITAAAAPAAPAAPTSVARHHSCAPFPAAAVPATPLLPRLPRTPRSLPLPVTSTLLEVP